MSKYRPYIKFYPEEFLTRVKTFTNGEVGAFALLIMAEHEARHKLINDPKRIRGVLNTTTYQTKRYIDFLIEQDCAYSDGKYLRMVLPWAHLLKREHIPKWVKEEVFSRDGKVCVYCQDTDGPFHLDHIIPWSKGGRDTVKNLTVACYVCNISKGDKLLGEWDGALK